MRTLTARAFFVAAVALVLVACGEQGSGDIVTEQREVPPFSSIEVSGGMNLILTVNEGGPQSLSVTYDDNLLDNVVTEVRGETLFVESEDAFNVFGSGRFVTVTMGALEQLSASGGSDVEGAGEVDEYFVEASGGADVDLRDLEAESVEVDVSGGADVDITATQSVTGSASGGADVTVHGDPPNSRVDVSGGADVDFN